MTGKNILYSAGDLVDIPIPGAVYSHRKAGDLYLVEGCLPIKLDGEWINNGVTIYIKEETRETYARFTLDFMRSFSFVSES